MKVYEVIFNWSTEDENNIETAIFSTYKKAKKYFNNIIKNENDAEISWVGDGVFDENGEVVDGYELNCNTDYSKGKEEQDLWWCVWNKDNDKYYDEIYLRIKELDKI